jgi:hypothetical protein
MCKIICPHCSREVELVKYGDGWVGSCCDRLVYNASHPPPSGTKTECHYPPLDSCFKA